MNTICPNIDQTLSALLSKYVLAIDVKTFLDTKDGVTGQTNWDRIKRRYSAKELKDNESKYPSGSMLVKKGTNLELRNSYLKRNLSRNVASDIFKNAEFKPFIAQQLVDLLKEPNYTNDITSYSGEKIATLVNNDITVYIWCRGLSAPNSTSQDGAWINVSAFIQTIQTRKDDVGSFNFTLPSVGCEWDIVSGWKMSSDLVGFDSGSVNDDVLSTSSILINDKSISAKGEFQRNKFFFNTVLQENDLVYIRFEKLELENDYQINGAIGASSIPNRIYDMIGLIDNVSLNTSPEDVSITVEGRDLMKILIEDGSYFFPEQFAQNIFTNEDSLLTKRNRYELEAQSLAGASYTFKSISTILKFIFNKFSNIGLVPNSVFAGYGDRAKKQKYQLKSSELKTKGAEVIDRLNDTFLKEERQGVWRICEFIFDPQVAQRVLADNTISQDNGSIINSIRKVCQEPFVEFDGDTYRDKFYFFVRKQPFDAKGYKGLVYDDFVSESREKRINSNSYVGKSIKEEATIVLGGNSESGRQSLISNLVIDIDDVDVLGEPQLSYHNEAYSWYRIIPRGLGISDEASSFQLAPVVPFDEYAEVWGNKTFSMEYNYAPTEYLQDSQAESEAKYVEVQAFYDLQFVIQCNQYLPFTRRGTITLTGNRTIKRGLFIYFKPTKEIFYVDAVTHVRTIEGQNNRLTILEVSRGMREKYIKGVQVEFPSGPQNVSYFDIINTSVSNDASINNKEFLKNWRVNKEVFNFFLQRRQWND